MVAQWAVRKEFYKIARALRNAPSCASGLRKYTVVSFTLFLWRSGWLSTNDCGRFKYMTEKKCSSAHDYVCSLKNQITNAEKWLSSNVR